MFKSLQLKSLLLIPVLFEVNSLDLLNLPQEREITQANIEEVIISKKLNKSPWDSLRDFIFGTPVAGGSRSIKTKNFCLIGINYGPNNQIWNDKPIFVWQGTLKQIRIKNPDDGSNIWKHDITPEEDAQKVVFYDGQPLQRRKEYSLNLTPSPETGIAILFKMMNEKDYETLKKQLPSDINSSNTISQDLALKRAIFFEEKAKKMMKNLTLDTWQSLYSVSNPSPEYREEIKKLKDIECK